MTDTNKLDIVPVNPSDENIELNTEQLNEELDLEKADSEEKGNVESVYDMADFFSTFATSMDQAYYVQTINDFVDNAESLRDNEDFKGFDIVFLTLYRILMMGFSEFNWEEDFEIKEYLPETLFNDTMDNKRVYIDISRDLFQKLDIKMGKVVKMGDTPDALALRNTIEHIMINWTNYTVRTFNNAVIVQDTLEGFTYLGINNDIDKGEDNTNESNEGVQEELNDEKDTDSEGVGG